MSLLAADTPDGWVGLGALGQYLKRTDPWLRPRPMAMLDDIKKTLWATADKLRANMDAAEYKHLVLGLIFVKYISTPSGAPGRGGGRGWPTRPMNTSTATPARRHRRRGRKTATTTPPSTCSGCPRQPAGKPCAPRPNGPRSASDRRSPEPDRGREPQAQGHPRQALRPRPAARRQAGRAGGPGINIGFGGNPSNARDVLGQVYEYFLGMFASAEGKRAASSTRRPASSRRWSPCWRHTTGRFTTPAAARAACSCRASVHRGPRRQAGRCPSTARKPTPPPGGWRR